MKPAGKFIATERYRLIFDVYDVIEMKNNNLDENGK